MRLLGTLLVLVAVCAGCAINDPTENTGPMTIRNRLANGMKISYCKALSCDSAFWTDSIDSGSKSSDSVDADGTVQRFTVVTDAKQRCLTIRLTRTVLHHGLSVTAQRLTSCPLRH